MTISNVTPTKIYDEGILKAEFSITIDDCITINDIKVIQKEQDITVSLPRRRNEDGIHYPIWTHIFCIMRSFLQMLQIRGSLKNEALP